MLPFKLLFGCYKYWCQANTARGDVNMGQRKFTKEFKERILPKWDGWELAPHSKSQFKVTDEMKTTPEPLIAKYNVETMKNPNYTGKDWDKISVNAQLLEFETGIVRVKK